MIYLRAPDFMALSAMRGPRRQPAAQPLPAGSGRHLPRHRRLGRRGCRAAILAAPAETAHDRRGSPQRDEGFGRQPACQAAPARAGAAHGALAPDEARAGSLRGGDQPDAFRGGDPLPPRHRSRPDAVGQRRGADGRGDHQPGARARRARSSRRRLWPAPCIAMSSPTNMCRWRCTAPAPRCWPISGACSNGAVPAALGRNRPIRAT